MSNSIVNEKLIQYFNEALAMENSAVDRNRTRMEEMPITGLHFRLSLALMDLLR